MLAGVSTRRYGRTGEPVGEDVDEVARSTSKSAVSRQFVSRTRENVIELMSRPLGDLRLAVLMLDGIELKGRCCVVALGIDTDGVKHPLGLWDGSTENATVATYERVEQDLLAGLEGQRRRRPADEQGSQRHRPGGRRGAPAGSDLSAAQHGRIDAIAWWAALLATQGPLLDRLATGLAAMAGAADGTAPLDLCTNRTNATQRPQRSPIPTGIDSRGRGCWAGGLVRSTPAPTASWSFATSSPPTPT